MPAHITLRMQFGPHENPEDIGRQLIDLVRTAKIDEIMFFYFAEDQNDGHDTLDRIQLWIDRSRPYRRMLADEGVLISLNPWHSILHNDRGRSLKPGQNWQTLVDPGGEPCTACVCPLDPNWQAYFAKTLAMYAAEDFRIIWIDDDIRFHNHGEMEWGGCFCPLHVAEFNRRAGVEATRQQILEKCLAPGEPHPWRDQWLDMWDDTQLELITQWRDVVETRGRRLGLMTSCMEMHAAEGRRWPKWWRALSSGDQPPAVRPHFWGYDDMPAGALSMSIAMLDQNRSVQPDPVDNGPEVECAPYGRWNKSFRQIHAQMALGIVLGATHLNVSLFDPMGNRPDDEPQRGGFLKRSRATMDWLAELFDTSLGSVGIGLPWSQQMGRTIRTSRGASWNELVCPLDGWASWLGAAGQAISRRPSTHVNALYGSAVWALDDDDLRRYLSCGLLLDATAACILIERGFGSLIGLNNPRHGRMLTQCDVPYSIEHCVDAAFALREGAQISINKPRMAPHILQAELADGARAVSEIRGPTQNTIGHGLVVYNNDLGGRVAVYPWDASNGVFMTAQRAGQFAKLMNWLDPANTRGHVESDAWVVPQFLTDGKQWRGVIWSSSHDDVDQLDVRLPAGMPRPTSVVHVAADSTRHELAFVDGHIAFDAPLRSWEFVVLS